MPVPQALLRFPGLGQVVRWSMTLSHGITPSACLVDIVPQAAAPADVGTLEIAFGSVRLMFPEAVIDRALVRRGPAGTIVGLAILDRRWKWRYGEVSGRYNLRRPDGTLDRDTEMSPQELAGLLLESMGESGSSTAELPNLSRPEVDWVSANPAAELAALCESLGCRVVMGNDGRVSIRQIGFGAALPNLSVQRTESFGIDPPARPGALRLVAGPSRFQTKFRLEAVGEDHDGAIRPIDELSYEPADGWGKESPFGFPNVTDPGDRSRAVRSVFRWYRIKCTAPDETRGTFRIPGHQDRVEELWQVLPLEEGLIETYRDADDVKRPRPAVVEGRYWPGSPDGDNLPEVRRFGGRFSLDHRRGIVRFDDAVVKRNSDGTLVEAELYLTIAHGVRDLVNRQEVRYTLERSIGGSAAAGVQVIRRDDLAQTTIGQYGTGNASTGTTGNRDELSREANAALDAAQTELATLFSADVEYAGIVPISPDGAIQQVAWSGGPDGAVTRAGRNTEVSLVVPTFEERRAAERQRHALDVSRRLVRSELRQIKGDR